MVNDEETPSKNNISIVGLDRCAIVKYFPPNQP